MKKYKINFSGFVYVEAENESEAIEKYEEGEVDSREEHWIDFREVK